MLIILQLAVSNVFRIQQGFPLDRCTDGRKFDVPAHVRSCDGKFSQLNSATQESNVLPASYNCSD